MALKQQTYFQARHTFQSTAKGWNMKMKRIFALFAAMTLVTAMASGCNSEGGGASSGPEWEYYTEWESNNKTDATNPGQDESHAESQNTSGGSNEKNTTKKRDNTKKTGSTVSTPKRTTGTKGKVEGAGELIVDGLGKDTFADYSVKGNVTVSINTSRPTDYEGIFDTFKKLYPNITLKFDYFTGSGATTDATASAEFMTARAAAGKLPDVVFDDAGTLPLYVSQGWLYPLDDFVKNDPDFKFIPDNIVKNYQYAGKLYALPHQAHYETILLNLDVMDTLNIKEPALDWTVKDYENLLKAGTTDVYSGTENIFNVIRFFSGIMSPTKDIGQFGYNQSSRKFEFAKSFNNALEYSWQLRTVPGLEAWYMRNSGTSLNDSDYAKKFGKSNLNDLNMAFKLGKTLTHAVGTWEYLDLKNSLKFDWELWPYPQNVKGQMPVHIDHSFMTSTCQNPKAAFALLRYVSYAVEGNIARLSMYDKVNKGKYALTSPLYYPVTTSPKVTEKFNSLPGAGKVEKYLFANIGNSFRVDAIKYVPEFEEIHQQYIYEPQCRVTDGIAKVKEVMPEAERKANEAMQKSWTEFETKMKKVQAEFKPKH